MKAKMHWKTKEKINRIINEKLDACPHNQSVWDMLTEEEREVYNERAGQPDRTSAIDWLMRNRWENTNKMPLPSNMVMVEIPAPDYIKHPIQHRFKFNMEYKMETKTIDVTPTWTVILPVLLKLFQNHNTQEDAVVELTHMAKLADAYVESMKELWYN